MRRRDCPEYRVWRAMKTRCYNTSNHKFPAYGGRGIVVCDAWKHDYTAFLAYIGPRPSLAYSIDRWPDNDGNYEPGNVRWATAKEQCTNRRRRSDHGERNCNAKLTNEQVADIRRRYTGKRGEQKTLRLEFGLSPATISKIVLGHSWDRVYAPKDVR